MKTSSSVKKVHPYLFLAPVIGYLIWMAMPVIQTHQGAGLLIGPLFIISGVTGGFTALVFGLSAWLNYLQVPENEANAIVRVFSGEPGSQKPLFLGSFRSCKTAKFIAEFEAWKLSHFGPAHVKHVWFSISTFH